ncbi:MAG TPA: zf-HC2 domain-containing protein, partial [Polyangia bacterium]|nr:zf-HC2 domain-containing protein [Polyangia bacterium]
MLERRSPTCPNEDQLLAFAEGRLTDPARDEVIEHVSHCDACMSAVAALGESSRSRDENTAPLTTFVPGDRV